MLHPLLLNEREVFFLLAFFALVPSVRAVLFKCAMCDTDNALGGDECYACQAPHRSSPPEIESKSADLDASAAFLKSMESSMEDFDGMFCLFCCLALICLC